MKNKLAVKYLDQNTTFTGYKSIYCDRVKYDNDKYLICENEIIDTVKKEILVAMIPHKSVVSVLNIADVMEEPKSVVSVLNIADVMEEPTI